MASMAAATLWLLAAASVQEVFALLRPQDSETREIKSLDGFWRFRLAPELDPEAGFRQRWFQHGLGGDASLMPVPSSFNDITQDP